MALVILYAGKNMGTGDLDLSLKPSSSLKTEN